MSACVYSTVTPIGPRRPSRPEGCPVDLFPDKQPPYPYAPIASARTECDPVRRQMCVDQLRSEACKAGADAIIGFKESKDDDKLSLFIDATFVAKPQAAPEVPAAKATPTGPAAKACEPICSPGFACQDGQCIPLCNPPCEQNEVCSRKRVCEPSVPPIVPGE